MNAKPLQFVKPADFHARARAALDDPKLRQSFRGAMDFLQDKRSAQFPDGDELERLRDIGEAVRQHALARLPDLLVQLEDKLTAAGVQVHWAEDGEQANAIIHAIAERNQAKRFIKGKSMASEEIELNHYLEARGMTCLESDMGEYIVQLAGEKPSHIVMPAIHKTKADIAGLFAEHIPDAPYTEDVDSLIQTGRRALRQAFVEADIGLTGVNFAAADTGTLWLVENEGNGRLTTSVPEVHIAIMGMEKVVAKLEHIVPLASLLTRSATGQAITTYFNLISGPRREGEKDGPREVHLVLLDNGRSQAYADEQLRATLQCIRCGACMNHCPVYTHRRPRLRHHVSGADRQDHFAPLAGAGRDGRPGHGVEPVRRLRRGVPRAHPDSAATGAPAHGGQPQSAGGSDASVARPGRQVQPWRKPDLAFLERRLCAPCQLPFVPLGRHAAAAADAARATGLDAAPQAVDAGAAQPGRPAQCARAGRINRPRSSIKTRYTKNTSTAVFFH